MLEDVNTQLKGKRELIDDSDVNSNFECANPGCADPLLHGLDSLKFFQCWICKKLAHCTPECPGLLLGNNEHFFGADGICIGCAQIKKIGACVCIV